MVCLSLEWHLAFTCSPLVFYHYCRKEYIPWECTTETETKARDHPKNAWKGLCPGISSGAEACVLSTQWLFQRWHSGVFCSHHSPEQTLCLVRSILPGEAVSRVRCAMVQFCLTSVVGNKSAVKSHHTLCFPESVVTQRVDDTQLGSKKSVSEIV